MGMSNISLRALGSGANAFRLTQRIVDKDVYQYTRNPMSLGYYLIGLALGFISGSTLLTLYVVLGIIPVHLFTLKFFEEFELDLRLGEPYRQYKQKVPFLIPKVTGWLICYPVFIFYINFTCQYVKIKTPQTGC